MTHNQNPDTITTNLENWTGEVATIRVIRRTATSAIFNLKDSMYCIYVDGEDIRISDRNGYSIGYGYIYKGFAHAFDTSGTIERSQYADDGNILTAAITAAARLTANL